MINIRKYSEEDKPALQRAIDRDAFHPGEWSPEHFEQPNVVSQVIEDQTGPIAFVLFTKTLRISCVWNDGADVHRNAKAIIFGIRDAVEKAKASGYTEVVVETDHEKLAEFFIRVMKMRQSGNQYFILI